MKLSASVMLIALAVAAPAWAQSGHSMSDHGGHAAQTMPGVAGTGAVDAVNVGKSQVKLTHAPIKAVGWPAMTMDFNVAAGVDLSKLKAGDKVDFEMVRGADGMYMINKMTKK